MPLYAGKIIGKIFRTGQRNAPTFTFSVQKSLMKTCRDTPGLIKMSSIEEFRGLGMHSTWIYPQCFFQKTEALCLMM